MELEDKMFCRYSIDGEVLIGVVEEDEIDVLASDGNYYGEQTFGVDGIAIEEGQAVIIKASHNIVDVLNYMDCIMLKKSVPSYHGGSRPINVKFLEPVFIQGFTKFEGKVKSIMLGLEHVVKIEDLTNDKIDWVLTKDQYEAHSTKVGE